MAKQADLKAAKERRQKIVAGVGGVIFVIVLFIQVPKTMKILNGGGEEPAAAAPAAPAPAAPAGAPAPAAPAAEPAVVTASLVSFSRFSSKDPFVQQVKPAEGSPPASSGGSSSGGGAITEPDDGSAPTEPAAFSQALITVNGVAETVRVDVPFPSTNPMFLLVSVSKKSVGIKVAEGGTFASGEPTLTLTLGKPVTLVNTADGTRFVLELKDVA